jgi:hypothetical protein
MQPVQLELEEDNLSEEIVEQKLRKEPLDLESTTEWPVSIIGDEGSMGD